MRYLFIYIFGLMIVFSGCTKPESDELVLNGPLSYTEVDYCCFIFEWDTYKDESQYIFKLATDSLFSDTIINTIVKTNSFELDRGLGSNQTYYWEVTAVTYSKSSSSSFNVIDYGEKYKGTYNATRRQISFQSGQITNDETTQLEIQMEKSTMEGHLQINGIHYQYFQKPSIPGCVTFFSEPYITGCIFPQQDSIAWVYQVIGDLGYEKITTAAKFK